MHEIALLWIVMGLVFTLLVVLMLVGGGLLTRSLVRARRENRTLRRELEGTREQLHALEGREQRRRAAMDDHRRWESEAEHLGWQDSDLPRARMTDDDAARSAGSHRDGGAPGRGAGPWAGPRTSGGRPGPGRGVASVVGRGVVRAGEWIAAQEVVLEEMEQQRARRQARRAQQDAGRWTA